MSSPVLAAQTPLPFREQPVLVQASRPLLPEGETLAGSQNGVGLYVNGERLPRFNAGTLYITSYRLLWVGEYSSGLALNTDCATSVIGFALSSILRLDSLSGFFTSSPKLILRIKVDSDGGNGQTHIPESVRISATVPFLSDPWRCSICEFANTNTADKCEHCGVQRIKSISKSGSEGLRYCPKCTCLNGIAAVTCEACGQLLLPLPPNNTSQDQQLATSAKSDIACPHCTYINASNAVTCEMCRGSLRLESGSQKDISTTVRRTDNSESSTLSTSALSQSVYEVKLSFRKGGMQALQGVLKRAMQRQAWNELSTLPSSSIDHTVRATQSLDALSESNTSAGAHINNDGSNSASAGLTSIISRNEQRAAGNKATLQSAFQDLDALMAKAAEMVKLAGSISDKIKINNASASESVSQGSTSSADAITSEETIQFRDFLVNLGIEGGAATKEGSGSSYHQELAKELVVFMDRLLGVQASAGSRSQGYKRQHTVGAIIPLADLYCMFNRTRGIGGLVSPSDLIAAMNLLQSCQGGRAAENVYSFKHFLQTGLLAIQCGQHFLDKQVMERIAGYLNEVQQVTVIGTETGDNVWRSVSGFELAKRENMYNVLCDRRNVPKIPLLQSILSICIEKKMFPEMLLLPGGHSEMRMRRLTDDDIDIILLAQEESDFIRVLDVSFNEIGDRGAEAIARWLKKVVTASQLNLASNNIGAQGAQYISEALHFNKSIKLLDVSGNNIEDDGGLHIAAMLQINTTLTHLRLVNNYLGVRALIALCTALRKNTTLKYLDISGNSSHIDTQTATTHEDISRHLKKMIMENTGIETLILGKLGFRDSTVQEYLSTAIQHCSLTTLDLRSNRIMRDGATALAKALWNHRTLENLSLAHNQIQDEGCIAISQMMKENDKLRKLDITHNNIHGPALRQLANCIEYANRTLRRLKVWGNHFDQGACESYDKLRSENSSGRFKPGSIDVTFYRVEDTWFCAKDENYSEELL